MCSDIVFRGEISIHAPREGCDLTDTIAQTRIIISIHAPREGCDAWVDRWVRRVYISIHAPREGCDRHHKIKQTNTINFNPRTP